MNWNSFGSTCGVLARAPGSARQAAVALLRSSVAGWCEGHLRGAVEAGRERQRHGDGVHLPVPAEARRAIFEPKFTDG